MKFDVKIKKIPSDNEAPNDIYQVTTETSSDNMSYRIHLGFVFTGRGYSAGIFVPRNAEGYVWETDVIALGTFDTLDEAIDAITKLSPFLWDRWLERLNNG